MATKNKISWIVGGTYLLKERLDTHQSDQWGGLDAVAFWQSLGLREPPKDTSSTRGEGKIFEVTNQGMPYGFQDIKLQVNGMVRDDGKPLLLLTGSSDLRIACTKWQLTTEEIKPASNDFDKTNHNAYPAVEKSRFFFQYGRLNQLENENDRSFIKRCLFEASTGCRWIQLNAIDFSSCRGAKFISEEHAIEFEKAKREEFKARGKKQNTT